MITDALFVPTHGGYFNRDQMAAKGGAPKDGFVYQGRPVTPGFDAIVEPGQAVSVMLVLDDGQVAVGEGMSVILAGLAGRDPVLHPADHLAALNGPVRDLLLASRHGSARALAEAVEALRIDGQPLHSGLRYGISQAIFAAFALRQRRSIAEVIGAEYGLVPASAPIAVLASTQQGDPIQLDRMILKRPDLLPHGAFSSVANDLGPDGGTLLTYVRHLVARVLALGGGDYRPGIHLDFYGSLGEAFGSEARVAAFIRQIEAAAAPCRLLVESPIIAATQPAQFDSYRRLMAAMAAAGATARIIMDEWCNTFDDIRCCAEQRLADLVQIKAPDLGGITRTIEALVLCRELGLGACLGGTANETDLSARITAQIGLACRPDFLLLKPGLGFDEGFMIQRNEMIRTLALIARRKAA